MLRACKKSTYGERAKCRDKCKCFCGLNFLFAQFYATFTLPVYCVLDFELFSGRVHHGCVLGGLRALGI